MPIFFSAARRTRDLALVAALLGAGVMGAWAVRAQSGGAAPATAAALPPVPAATEAAIRKALPERIPSFPKIDEVRGTPVPGLFEVRYAGSELIYSDAKGEHLLQGALIETKTMSNLTEVRQDQLSAVAFSEMPIKDALVYKQGSGARKMAVFVDPNCGYCKRFERDLLAVKDVTIYAFVLPILGPDSTAKSRDIWCAKDPAKAWRQWMIDSVTPPKADDKCDVTALARNGEFARKYRINGTPAVFFEDGTRKPGALPLAAVEQLLSKAAAAKKG
jgi:thiol:disulfide interchange protein DsbC